MKFALFGYGTMGKLIHHLADSKGHTIVAVLDGKERHLPAAVAAEKIAGADVAIDFSSAEAVEGSVAACLSASVPLVEGTTGWSEQRIAIERSVVEADGAMVIGANFSLGVNLFYRISAYAASLFASFPDYEAFIEEQHHSRKKDAPSGTALELQAFVERHVSTGEIAATRAGNIPGTHRVGFDGPADQLLLQHTARSREGFALGAIAAAEWIVGKRGVYEFRDVVDEIIKIERMGYSTDELDSERDRLS